MIGYVIVKKDGTFVKGDIPKNIDLEKFCIMCAASYGAGYTAYREVGEDVEEVTLKSEHSSIIIRTLSNGNLLVVIGTPEEMNETFEKVDKP